VEADIEWDCIIGELFAANNGKFNVLEGGRHAIAIVTPDAVSSDEPVNDDDDDTKLLATTSRYSPPPLLLSDMSLATPSTPSNVTLSTSHVLLKDDLTTTTRGSSAALAMSSLWKTDTTTPELAHKSNRFVLSHVDDDLDEKWKKPTTAALERGVIRVS
jgi:hypothetical protein